MESKVKYGDTPEKKTERINVRCTKSEKDKLEYLAKLHGVGLSEYILKKALEEPLSAMGK